MIHLSLDPLRRVSAASLTSPAPQLACGASSLSNVHYGLPAQQEVQGGFFPPAAGIFPYLARSLMKCQDEKTWVIGGSALANRRVFLWVGGLCPVQPADGITCCTNSAGLHREHVWEIPSCHVHCCKKQQQQRPRFALSSLPEFDTSSISSKSPAVSKPILRSLSFISASLCNTLSQKKTCRSPENGTSYMPLCSN